MNPYAIVALAALVGELVLRAVADFLNLRALDAPTPPELAEIHGPERSRLARDYTRQRTLFGLARGAWHLGLLLAFWAADGFGRLDELVRSFELGPIGSGLGYVGALTLASSLADLPFRWASTFRLEERFGFNRTTPRTFWADEVKGLVLAALLGGGLLAAVLATFEHAGERAWLWCWAVVAAFLLLVQYVAPTWLLPLFNRFEPLPQGELRSAILEYARSVHFPVEGIYTIDGSRRSSKANAFFTGFGRRKRIALFDTLVAKQRVPELLAVVAHEIGHSKLRHVLRSTVLGVLRAGALLWLFAFLLGREELYLAFGVEQPSVYAGLVLFSLVASPIGLVLGPALLARSRRDELQADAFAARTTSDPGSLASALKELAAENLTNLTPHPFHVALFHSHPPLLRRIERLRSVRPSPQAS